MQISRTWKWCFCGLPLALFFATLLLLAFGIVNGDSRSVLGSCVFLLVLALGCAAAAVVNLGALKFLGKLMGKRETGTSEYVGHESAP